LWTIRKKLGAVEWLGQTFSRRLGKSLTAVIQSPYLLDTASAPCSTPVGDKSSATEDAEADSTPLTICPVPKRMRPATTREHLESKIDNLIKQQASAQEQQQKHMEDMRDMFERQHKDRMEILKEFIKVIGSKAVDGT